MISLPETLLKFLLHHLQPNVPFLLALSGGADSIALFHLLCHTKQMFPFAVAHVDHRWRKESAEEASILRKKVEAQGIAFHLKELIPENFMGNLESYCRDERIKFFVETCVHQGYQGVITAHHADDRAESTLKKLLEGSPFIYLDSLQTYHQYYPIPFWRPLITFSKQEIIGWLKKHNIEYFEDPTNNDCHYMRAKFRHQLIPLLAQTYGKQINRSITRLAEESKELKEYVESLYANYQDCIAQGPFGIYLDLNSLADQTSWEIKVITQTFLTKQGIFPSYDLLKQLLTLITENKAAKQIEVKHQTIYVDRKKIFIKKDEVSLKLKGEWKLNTEALTVPEPIQSTDWKQAWLGQAVAVLPSLPFVIEQATSDLSKWLGNAKVPSFFWKDVPVLRYDGGEFHDFFTGHIHPKFRKMEGEVKISMKWVEYK